MAALRVGFIGTGKKPEKPGPLGYGMAHQHAAAYQSLPAGVVEIVAVADLSRENAEAFCDLFHVDKNKIYTDYHAMLAQEKLDIVSVATWPHLHAPMVLACARAHVKGVFCEKPMADGWGAARKMHDECRAAGTWLAFNHQRRYGKPFRIARKLIVDGAIGKLQQVQFTCGDIYDYGTHSFDLSNYLNGEQRAKWVLANIDYRQAKVIFGAHCENQAIVIWEYENGVLGLAATSAGRGAVLAHNKAIGSEGILEIGPQSEGNHPTQLRIHRFGQGGWEYVDCSGEHCHGPGYIERAIADFIQSVQAGKPSEVDSENALKGTEIIFAAYESSRRHGRVDLPLTISDNPLVSMVNDGTLKVEGLPAPKPAPKPAAARKSAPPKKTAPSAKPKAKAKAKPKPNPKAKPKAKKNSKRKR